VALSWTEIFASRPDLEPPGYREGVMAGQARSQERYERLGRRRAGHSGRSKEAKYPSLKHSYQD